MHRNCTEFICVISTCYVNYGAEVSSAIFLWASDFLEDIAAKRRWRGWTEKLCKLGIVYCGFLSRIPSILPFGRFLAFRGRAFGKFRHLFRRPVLRNRSGTERTKGLVLFRHAFRLEPTNFNMLYLKRYAPMFRGTEQLKRYAPRNCYDTASIPFLVMLHLLDLLHNPFLRSG